MMDQLMPENPLEKVNESVADDDEVSVVYTFSAMDNKSYNPIEILMKYLSLVIKEQQSDLEIYH